MKRFLFFIFSILIVACGNDPKETTTLGSNGEILGPNGEAVSSIRFDSSVPSDQQQAFATALAKLPSINITSPKYPDLMNKIVGVSDYNGATLLNWIQQRVKYIVGESYDYDSPTQISQTSYNPQIMALTPSQFGATIMVNVGGYLYLQGKKNSRVYGLPINGQTISVKSPRSGIVQIGEGLFRSYLVSSSSRDSLANIALLVTVLMHEARHSDGNGKDVAFPHQIKYEYDSSGDQVSRAYEPYTNGPYSLEWVMLYEYYLYCQQRGATSAEQEKMKLFLAEIAGKVKDTAKTYADPRPEAIP